MPVFGYKGGTYGTEHDSMTSSQSIPATIWKFWDPASGTPQPKPIKSHVKLFIPRPPPAAEQDPTDVTYESNPISASLFHVACTIKSKL